MPCLAVPHRALPAEPSRCLTAQRRNPPSPLRRRASTRLPRHSSPRHRDDPTSLACLAMPATPHQNSPRRACRATTRL